MPAPPLTGTGWLVTSRGARDTGSSMSRGLWHFLQRELLVLYCISLQYSHRTTSRVSTLTIEVAIWDARSARAVELQVHRCTVIGATFNE